MKVKRSFFIVSMLLAAVVFSSLTLPQERDKHKNLKVLPKNISHDELDSIMKSFKTALGVKCSFCHAQRKDDPTKLDFASDENKHKDVARGMMRMTMRINKKYFKGEVKNAVSCYTCHNGHEEPKMASKEEKEEE